MRAKGKLLGYNEDGMPEFEGNYKEYYENGTLMCDYNFDNKGNLMEYKSVMMKMAP